mgnify:FL=1
MSADFLKNKKLIWIGRIIGALSFFIIPYIVLDVSNVMGGERIERCIISTETKSEDNKLIKKLESLFDRIKGSKEVSYENLSQDVEEAIRRIADDNDRFVSAFQKSSDFIRYEMLLKNRTYFSLGGIQDPGKSEKYSENEYTKARCIANGKEIEIQPKKKAILLSRLKLKEDVQMMVSSTDSCLNAIGQSVPQTSKWIKKNSTTIDTIGLGGCVNLTIRPDKKSHLVAYIIFFSGWIAVLYVLKKGPIKFYKEGFDFFKDK